MSGYMSTRVGVLEEMSKDLTGFPADSAGTGAHAPGSHSGRVGAPTARCCAMREVAGEAAILDGAIADEDAEAAAAAERLRSGRWGYRFCKRAFDIAFSLVVLVGLSWLYLIIAFAIKIDDPKGPVIFAQTRVGKDGREFRMYKFRSMVADAEARLAGLLERNEKTGPVFKLHDDPRITRAGRILRKVSLDELPQFVNVLKGDLSVVGPRPALPKEVAEYTARGRQRLLVKQGLTCLWQVQPDRDDIGFDEWVELDLRYIRECGAATDMKLIARTVVCVLTAQGR